MDLVKPTSILKFNEVKYLRPDERETYIRSVILEILSLNENGISISEVSDMTKFNRITIAKHIEYLTSIREAYKKERRNGAIYFKNGRLIHPTGKEEVNTGDKRYAFFMLENNEGNFIYIQEKERDMNRALKVKGGILIPLKEFQSFIDGLIQFTMKHANVEVR